MDMLHAGLLLAWKSFTELWHFDRTTIPGLIPIIIAAVSVVRRRSLTKVKKVIGDWAFKFAVIYWFGLYVWTVAMNIYTDHRSLKETADKATAEWKDRVSSV